jgi:hypothetical protein
MTNKDLLKEAIAEATTIREAAIANAKEALEESITPHLREMLAQKLQEMDELEETDNNGTDSQVDGEGDDIDHGNIVNEDEDEDTEEEAPEEEAEETEEEDEEFDLENMTKAEFTAEVEKIVAQVNGAPEGEEAEMPGGEDLEGMEDDNTIDIDELLAELEGMNEGGDLDEYTSGGGGWGGGSSAGNFSLKPGEKDEGDIEKMIKAIAAKTGKSITAISNFLYGGKSVAPGETSWKESAQDKEDLMEALKAVKILRNQLQEVNLLNAKLLYVNKVFKSNNLSEGQKVNVIAAFDKAETVKEVKLVFETVSKNVVVKKPTTVKEHRSFASKATGMTAAPKKEIISEVSEQVLRMQKLAGIIK